MNAKKECRSARCKSAAKKSLPHHHDSLVTESQQENDEPPRPDRTTQARRSESTAQINWLTGHFSNRRQAVSLYKRGMAKAKNHDHQGAIDDYTTTINMPDTPANVKAMVLYNRALVHVVTGDDGKGIDDLDAVMAMDEAPVSVKTMARKKLAKRETRSRKSND